MSVINKISRYCFSVEGKFDCIFRDRPVIKKIIQVALIILGGCLFLISPVVVGGLAVFLGLTLRSWEEAKSSLSLKPASCEWGKFDYGPQGPTLYLDTPDPYVTGKAQGYLFGEFIQSIRGASPFSPSSPSSPPMNAVLPEDQSLEMKGIVEGYNRWASERPAPHKPMTLEELLFLLKSKELHRQNFPLCLRFNQSPIESPKQSRYGSTLKIAGVAAALGFGISDPLYAHLLISSGFIYTILGMSINIVRTGFFEYKHFRHSYRSPSSHELRQIFEDKIKKHPNYDLFKLVAEKKTDEEFFQYFIDAMRYGTCLGVTTALLKKGMEDSDAFTKIDNIKTDEIVMNQFIHHMRNRWMEKNINQSPEWQKRHAELNFLKAHLTEQAFNEKLRYEFARWVLKLDAKWNEFIKNELDDSIPTRKESALFVPHKGEDFRKVFSQLGIEKEIQMQGRALGYVDLPNHVFAFECTPTHYRIYDINPPVMPSADKGGLYEFDREEDFMNALTKHVIARASGKPTVVRIGLCPVRSKRPPVLETPLVKALLPLNAIRA